MTIAITAQIRARLDAIATERPRLDDEERRLKKALEALESTAAVEDADNAETRIGDRIVNVEPTKKLDEWLKPVVDRMPPLPPYMPAFPYQPPHYPAPSWDHWVMPDGPQIDIGPGGRIRVIGSTLPAYEVDGITYVQPTTVCSASAGDSLLTCGHNQD